MNHKDPQSTDALGLATEDEQSERGIHMGTHVSAGRGHAVACFPRLFDGSYQIAAHG